MVKCKICNLEFETDKSFHGHLKSHKLRMVEYYQTHEPRYDLLTGELINFKNKDYYFSNDFNNKISMKKWLKGQVPEAQKDYLKKLLSQRKEKHNLIYAPTEVELRSITSPPIPYYHNLFNDYYKLCGEVGFKNKYQYPEEELNCEIKQGFKIFIDTREQMPLVIDYPTEVKGLKFGDYAINDPENKCYIERKSIEYMAGIVQNLFYVLTIQTPPMVSAQFNPNFF